MSPSKLASHAHCSAALSATSTVGSALDGTPAPSAGCSPNFSDSDVKLSLRNQSYSSG